MLPVNNEYYTAAVPLKLICVSEKEQNETLWTDIINNRDHNAAIDRRRVGSRRDSRGCREQLCRDFCSYRHSIRETYRA